MKVKSIKKKMSYVKNNKIQVLFRTALSLFVILGFLLVFFLCDGILYFSPQVVVDSCKGSEMEVHFIDIGQGDASLIKFPNDKIMLIDTGESSQSEMLVNYLNKFLKLNNIEKIDYLVLTHPDADHVGGTKELTLNFGIGLAFRPKYLSVSESMMDLDSPYKVFETATYEETISSLYESQIEMKYSQSGISFNEGGAKIEFLGPIEENYSSSNNYSAVIKISYGSKSFLFMGDAEVQVENELIENYGNLLDVDVLKVSHHGSDTASSDNFLKIVTPSYSCISVAKDNKYDLPNNSVVERLKSYGSEVIMTSEKSSFAIALNENLLSVHFLQTSDVDFSIILAVCGVAITLIWGIKLPKSNS